MKFLKCLKASLIFFDMFNFSGAESLTCETNLSDTVRYSINFSDMLGIFQVLRILHVRPTSQILSDILSISLICWEYFRC